MKITFFEQKEKKFLKILSGDLDKDNISFNPLELKKFFTLFKNISEISVIFRKKA